MNVAVRVGIYAMESLFVIGIFGSAIVVLLTTVEDSEVFFTRTPPAKAETKPEDLD